MYPHQPQQSQQTLPPPEYDESLKNHGPLYSSMPLMGSLGTPHIGSRMGFRGSSSGSHRGHRRSTPNRYYNNNNNNGGRGCEHITLVATRPLLQALARECRPFPPWCVGNNVPEDLTEELQLFAAFLQTTPEEQACIDRAIEITTEILHQMWPDAQLKPMSTTAAGLPPHKEVTLHYYAENTSFKENDMESIKGKLQAKANDNSMQVEFTTDYRETPCIVLTDTLSGKKLIVRFGPNANNAALATKVIKEAVAENEGCRATLAALDALLRQNKILDDSATSSGGTLNGEALVTMLTSVFKSYSPGDAPDAGRLLMDFFLTFGFAANFSLTENSVTVKGMSYPTPKVHRNAQMSVLDPSDETRNLTPKMDKAIHLQAVFNYCYTALSQFSQVAQRQRRAQSTLSTIIGGETYWGRVLKLYHEGITPFVEVVEGKKDILAHVL